jgi:lysophospholipase L1-like esterase
MSGTWSWFYYRYTGNPAYNYYVMTRYETESTITPDAGGLCVKVYTYEDEGKGNTDVNPFYGKTVAVFGDSIVQGRFRKNGASSTNAVMSKPYPVLLSELCNTEPGDYGIGGATVYGSGWNTLYTRRQAVTGYDVVLVHAGTNDFGDNISESDFKAAYETVLTALKGNNTKVYAVTPVTRATNNANAGSKYLSDYAQWVRDSAAAKSVDVIDLYALTASDDLFKSQLPDNIHPNETGQKMIADLILNNIP